MSHLDQLRRGVEKVGLRAISKQIYGGNLVALFCNDAFLYGLHSFQLIEPNQNAAEIEDIQAKSLLDHANKTVTLASVAEGLPPGGFQALDREKIEEYLESTVGKWSPAPPVLSSQNFFEKLAADNQFFAYTVEQHKLLCETLGLQVPE